MCSGKTFFTNAIKETLGDACSVVRFSSPLYDICRILGMEGKDRAMLQQVGQALRGWDEKCFIKAAIHAVKQERERLKDMPGMRVIICEDIRFRNELYALQAVGFWGIYLDLPVDVRMERLKSTYPANFEDHLARMSDPSEQVGAFKNMFDRVADAQMTAGAMMSLVEEIAEQNLKSSSGTEEGGARGSNQNVDELAQILT